ncbi:MAG: hypothetical protein AAF802_12550, partial [Planctomycetota bacterium]
NWHGFNFATIGGAHHYHQPSDTPDALSDRTLQHMAEHLFAVHRALDEMTESRVEELNSRRVGDAVFFDLMGVWVIHYSESTQRLMAWICFAGLSAVEIFLGLRTIFLGLRTLVSSRAKPRLREDALRFLSRTAIMGVRAMLVASSLAVAIASAVLLQVLYRNTSYGSLRYTPFDLAAGMLSVLIAFSAAYITLASISRFVQRRSRMNSKRSPCVSRRLTPNGSSLAVWSLSAVAVLLCYRLPGGAYLVAVPIMACAVSLAASWNRRVSAWCGWCTVSVLAGPLLPLLVQALGPWQQPIYATIAGLLAISAWNVSLPQATLRPPQP